MQQDNLFEILKKVKCFSVLDDETLKLLKNKMTEKIIEADTIICNQGEFGEEMFIIEKGEVSVLKKGNDGILAEITTLKNGDVAGEMSLFGSSIRSATLKTVKKTEIWVLDHSTFQDLIDNHPSLSKSFISYLINHIHNSTSLMAKMMTNDLDKRFKIAFFDSKPYMKSVFNEINKSKYLINYFENKLTPETVSLAAGHNAICVFVNDIVDEEILNDLNNLGIKLVALRCAGFNNVDLAACKKLGISVVRVPAYSPYAVAEHAVSLMMALNRRLYRAYNRVRDSNFSLNGLVGFDMHNKTVGVIGAGKIGKCTINILAGFGCKLLVHTKGEDEELLKMGVQFVDIDDLFKQSDIITLHVPLMPQTHYMINAEAIEKCKTGVMIINTSRGGLIDTKALLDGLKSGKVGYAGLDVYEEEHDYFFEDLSNIVLTDDILARLTTYNNVIVTSHQAFLTNEALTNIAGTTLDNISEFESGKREAELPNHVIAK